jgi:ribonucleoside-diphosphate reductase alpha chain
MPYDSAEALVMIDKIYQTIRNAAYYESSMLAKERGAFPVFNWEKEKNNAFIKNLPEDIRELIRTVGRRNISILTNAPTGSVSIMSQTSSGLEPVFRNFYIRRRKLSHNEQDQMAAFVDAMGDKWTEYKVYHHNVQEYLKKFETNQIPSFFTESDSIDWKRRVEIQGVIQQYIDHSISSTINLPKGTSPDVVSELYLLGWKLGLKGITVYVDGSRDGVLITETKKEEFPQHNAPKRPTTLETDIHNLTIKGEKWTILVGLMDGKPYEILGGANKIVDLPKNAKKGELVKTSVGKNQARYDLVVGDLAIRDVVKVFDNANHSAFTRLLSLSLRHGAPINYVVEQMQKEQDSDMFSFARSIARVLKQYVPDGTKATGVKTCTECSSTNLIYQDGCVTCGDCGNSKCG